MENGNREFITYICIEVLNSSSSAVWEVINHLSMNGYKFGYDSYAGNLFVYDEELAYVETILEDRGIDYRIEEV